MSADFTPEKRNYKILPPFKMQVLTNFPYIEADFDALTNYQLLCKVVEYLNMVIHNENELTEEVEGLYNAYVSLQNYVNSYFDNLDVQDEINNKLDEMAESGQLTDIIAQYLGLAGMITFNTVAEMKLAENLVNGSKCTTLGYHEVNDGGNALYKIRNITNDDVIDDMTIIAVYDDLLVAELIANDSVNIKQLGANGINTNDTKALKCFANSNIKNLIIPSGTYYLNDIIDLNNKELNGYGNPIININGITTSREHQIHISGSCKLNGINFIQTIANTNIIGLFNSNNSIIENCTFKVDEVACNGYVDLYTNNHDIIFNNCKFECISLENDETTNAYGGLWVRENDSTKTSYNIYFNNCIFNHRSRDEIIACWNWNGLIKNVQINNTILEASNLCTAQNLIRFDGENSSINDCIIIYKPTDNDNRATIINAGDQTAYTNCNNTKFDLGVTLTNGIAYGNKLSMNNCQIFNTKDTTLGANSIYRNCYINVLSIQNRSIITLINCILDITQKNSWTFGSSVTLENCTFNFSSVASDTYDLIIAFEANRKMIIKNCTFNLPSDRILRIGTFRNYATSIVYTNNYTNSLSISEDTNTTGVIANNIYNRTFTENDNIKYNNNFYIG